ncbi:tyrosine-type recombinase/integrase [Enterobacter hormaechei]|uniref:tyrosine-type recombinase/integrase n=1 Tax=Enterobacter hormaechei TaxID=158836 RepID=UPI0012B91528|nr:site-specific integrase [Enterobacter hormaechei]WJT25602.1 site-specific integrase [Klebsiella pneumoniae]HBC0587158.1 site-specific integrase [Enterobacter cloacae]MBT2056210.1 site-specific integrase [Enterobacter hormaechei subsp. hoffmannii]MCW4742573.1 site-specific integrase [Enterobacter hormaechei subsp. hoffmannii]WJT56117.1 site-specific integrase [Klebsiella pneumoniae]
MSNFYVKNFIFEDGERYCLLFNRETDIPMYYENMYITVEVRNRTHSVKTMEAVSRTLLLFNQFLKLKDINIIERVMELEFLTIYEIDELLYYLGLNHTNKKIVKITHGRRQPVSVKTKYNRINWISRYLNWLSEYLLHNKKVDVKKINDFIRTINSKKPKLGYYDDYYTSEPKSLDENQKKHLFSAINASSPQNPFSKTVRIRNELIVIMLYMLGVRAGELLNIRLRDIDLENRTIKIVRRHDDLTDNRVKQPLVKTLNRNIYMSDWLESKIYFYIQGERQKYIKKNKHDFLFITQGNSINSGLPLTIAAYEKLFERIKGIDSLPKDFSGHKLRHTWNYEFSKEVRNATIEYGNINEELIRSYIMGWVPNTNISKVYNQRFMKEICGQIQKAIQNRMYKTLEGF